MNKLWVCILAGMLILTGLFAQDLEGYALSLSKGGEETGIGVSWEDIEYVFESQLDYFYQYEGFDAVFDGLFVKFDIAENLAQERLLELYLADNPEPVDPGLLSLRVSETVLMPGDEPYITLEWIEAEFGSMDEYIQTMTQQIELEMQKELLYKKLSQVSREEMEAYFEQERQTLSRDYNRVWAKHILVETLGEAETLKEAIQSGEISFDDAAAVFSLDAYNKNEGGDLGWFYYGQMVPEFEQAAFGSQPGSLEGPVQTQYGYHLLYIVDLEILTEYEQFDSTDLFFSIQREMGQEKYHHFMNAYAQSHQIDYTYYGNLKALMDFINVYTLGFETGDFSRALRFLRDYSVALGDMDGLAFYEIALEAVLEAYYYGMIMLSDEDYDLYLSKRLDNLKTLSQIPQAEYSALIKYFQLNPSDSDMAIRLFEAHIHRLLEMTYDDFMFMYYGEAIINNLMQVRPMVAEIAYDEKSSVPNQIKALILIAEIDLLAGNEESVLLLMKQVLELDPEHEYAQFILNAVPEPK